MRYIIVIMNPLIPQPSDHSDEEITHHLAMEVYQATQEANQWKAHTAKISDVCDKLPPDVCIE